MRQRSSAFASSHRCWFVSLCVLGRAAQEQTLLSELLATDPCPFARHAPDLWLQRRAIVQLVRHGGVEALCALQSRDPATTGVLCGDKNPPVTTGPPPLGRRVGGRRGGAECLGRGVTRLSSTARRLGSRCRRATTDSRRLISRACYAC